MRQVKKKLIEIAENVQKVYNAGLEDGGGTGDFVTREEFDESSRGIYQNFADLDSSVGNQINSLATFVSETYTTKGELDQAIANMDEHVLRDITSAVEAANSYADTAIQNAVLDSWEAEA